MHHAFAVGAEREEGISIALDYVERELGLAGKGNPDVITLTYGLLSVEEARRIASVVSQAPVVGDKKAVIIVASRAYHEAQNALLKVFEEPAPGTYLFLVVPSIGQLLPTLRSRIVTLTDAKHVGALPEAARSFLAASREKRSAIAKKLATGKDEDERRTNRDEALMIVNGIEMAAYEAFRKGNTKVGPLLAELAAFRNHLHDRSAPVRMILEHLALVVPKTLLD